MCWVDSFVFVRYCFEELVREEEAGGVDYANSQTEVLVL